MMSNLMPQSNLILHGDNLHHLKGIPDESVQLIYIDPPFNTGKKQRLTKYSYDDAFADFIGFLKPRLIQAHRTLTPNGSLFFHIDWRESARCRLLLDDVFGGQQHCINEIIWAYDYGGRSKNRWPAKHDTIYWYAKDPDDYTFNYDAIDRIPYLAPQLVGKDKAKRGKSPTDTWWQTIVPTSCYERTGYPTQKPLQILDRIVRVHSNVDDVVMDFFAGSGTAGDAANRNGRRYIMIDENPDAIAVMEKRLMSKPQLRLWKATA